MLVPSKRILIYRLGSLGDTIIALPVFHLVRHCYPDAYITLLTNKPVKSKAAPLESVLGTGYFFNRTLPYSVGTRSVRTLFGLIKQIRELEIDTVIYLVGVRGADNLAKAKATVLRDRLFFKAAGVKRIVGLPNTIADYLTVQDVNTGMLEWEAKRLARRVNTLGTIDLNDDRNWDLKFSVAEINAAKAAVLNIHSDKPVIVISTGTKSPVNDWGESNWQALVSRLKSILTNWQLIMIGGPDEFDQAQRYVTDWGPRSINLCGKVSPRLSGLVLKSAQVFVGHDSGPMHLAACVGTPCVGIFSARHLPGQWFPRGRNNRIIYHKTDCAGCLLDVCIVQKKKCILSITVNEVEAAILELLDNLNLGK
ncbi:glycosyltransferase family 9 protein [Mucilaginibacter terrenus]|uniref:Glycosyltransferase family 9 protein n=1 Tax=Mucilaginibacter terrenus TaxID=2482727 RepID=A0A3E2NXS3_9SPHI|nr:glycosyltransferase family 9 protein [Mucilaginibacter terrenus]RFZ85782.1 glycosyltransferase family 9 protein [Mucilaginibacter terrenus]